MAKLTADSPYALTPSDVCVWGGGPDGIRLILDLALFCVVAIVCCNDNAAQMLTPAGLCTSKKNSVYVVCICFFASRLLVDLQLCSAVCRP